MIYICLQTVTTASELRKPVYRSVAAQSVDYDQMFGLMSAVKWDVHEIMSLHSNYVDVLLQVSIFAYNTCACIYPSIWVWPIQYQLFVIRYLHMW